MRILVTGSRGLLGSAICELARDKFDVLEPSRQELDLSDFELTLRYIENKRPDAVIHTAAAVFGLGGHKLHPNRALLANSRIDINLVSALHEFPVSKFIYVGTVASYGYPYVGNRLNEKDFFSGVPHSSEYGYAMAKRFGFDLTKSLCEIGADINYVSMTNLFGPHDNFNSQTGHVIPSLISRAVNSSQEKSVLKVWGKPTDTRDFMYSYKAARRILQLLSTNDLDLINIGSGIERSISMVVDTICDKLGIKEVTYEDSDLPTISHRVLDISLLESKFGKFEDDFKSEIETTIDWYLANQEIARK
jgi:GDP-L-fucose synthase